VEGEVALGHADDRFDERGSLTDDNLREELQEVVEALMDEVRPRVAAAA
jgi:hypothetical protein